MNRRVRLIVGSPIMVVQPGRFCEALDGGIVASARASECVLRLYRRLPLKAVPSAVPNAAPKATPIAV